jgi:hypothetical protein
MKREIFVVFAAGLLASGLMGCFSLGRPNTSRATVEETYTEESLRAKREEKKKTGLEGQKTRFTEQFQKDMQLLTARRESKGEGGVLTAADLDEILNPVIILRKKGLDLAHSEPGEPAYLKVRAIYKGFDKKNGNIYLEFTSPDISMEESLLHEAYGVDSAVFSVLQDEEPVRVKEPNTLATFYLVEVWLSERGKSASLLSLLFIDDNDIVVLFDKSKFIVASGMSYISAYDTFIFTQENIMMNLVMGGNAGTVSANIFDPIKYPLVDLMDARAAMDKKDIRNGYTSPAVKVKYVSEVVFKGQSNTTITVSTDDNVLTERMNFTGRASTVKNGDRIRVYYTIAKDPLEKWEIQAIERL